MINNLAFGIKSTRSRTRICAFLLYTGLILRAFRTNYTLWFACRWSAHISHIARAHRMVINYATLTVWATRGRFAWIAWCWCSCRYLIKTLVIYSKELIMIITCWLKTKAQSSWISCKSWNAYTRRRMVKHLTFSVNTAGSWTWIDTFIIHTRSSFVAICIYNAFWSASRVRIAEVFGKARARSSTILFFANSISAARRWITWVERLVCCRYCNI